MKRTAICSPVVLALCAAALAAVASAKLPAPSDEAKAKAAEAAAKTAHADKVAAYQLCKARDKVTAEYFASARKAGKAVKPGMSTPACVNPGPFAYKPAA